MALNILKLCKNHLGYLKNEGKFLKIYSNTINGFIPLLYNSNKNFMEHLNITCKSLRTTSSRYEMFNVQDEDDFKEKVLKSNIPVIVDFHANWCGPCKLLGPRLEGIIGGKKDKVHLAKIDIDSVSDLALEYGVSAVPSVLAFKNGKVVDKFIGLQEETRISAFVNKLINE